MHNRLASDRHANLGQSGWLLMIVTALLPLLLLSGPSSAQERQAALSMRLVSRAYPYEATAGQDNAFFLELDNVGSQALTGIALSSETPPGWAIDIRPAYVDYLAPGALQTVDVNIRPPQNVLKRDHEITLIAKANEVRQVHSLWVTVRTPLRLWIVAAVVLVVIASFVAIFVQLNQPEPRG